MPEYLPGDSAGVSQDPPSYGDPYCIDAVCTRYSGGGQCDLEAQGATVAADRIGAHGLDG